MAPFIALFFFAVALVAPLHIGGVAQPEYIRPPSSPELSLDHQSLRKKSDKPHDPEQIHLSLAGPGRVAVSWVTRPQDDTELAARVARSPVAKHKKSDCAHLIDYPLQSTTQFGLKSGKYSLEATGGFTCYGDSEYESGALHTVVLGNSTPLLPATKYFYRAGDPQYGWSQENSFVTAPQIGPGSVPYKLGLIGDLGQTEDSAATLKHLDGLDVASVLDVGDLSYADSYQPRWDSYGRLLEFHTSKVAWMHIEGNHEEEVLGGDDGFVAYEKRFWFPKRESGSQSPFYYSYETGPLHVIMLGCYVEYSADSDQAEWLHRDLASVDRSRTPWLIVGMHAPWYSSNTAHQGEVDDMREALEPLLHQHGVDAVFAGHVHAYERSGGGVYSNKREKCAPTYVVIGDGGNREGLASDYFPKPDWSEVREASFGMGLLSIENSTHAVWQWHRNKDELREVADEFWLERTAECSAEISRRLWKASLEAGDREGEIKRTELKSVVEVS